jgi:hypothetical protein
LGAWRWGLVPAITSLLSVRAPSRSWVRVLSVLKLRGPRCPQLKRSVFVRDLHTGRDGLL